jgi:hypothetical protein
VSPTRPSYKNLDSPSAFIALVAAFADAPAARADLSPDAVFAHEVGLVGAHCRRVEAAAQPPLPQGGEAVQLKGGWRGGAAATARGCAAGVGMEQRGAQAPLLVPPAGRRGAPPHRKK